MLMSFLLHRKTFETYKYISVLLITVGVSLFMLLHPQKATRDSPPSRYSSSEADLPAQSWSSSVYGLLLLLINLLVDGATNSTQDHIFMRWKVNGAQMMFFMNAFSCVLMLAFLVFVTPWLTSDGGELKKALVFLATYPESVKDVMLFGICGALGQVFIFYTLERFGSLLLVTINVTRKMMSMLLSVFWFNHILSWGQWAAVGIVFGGISIEALMAKKKTNGVTAKKTEVKQDGEKYKVKDAPKRERSRGRRQRVQSSQ